MATTIKNLYLGWENKGIRFHPAIFIWLGERKGKEFSAKKQEKPCRKGNEN